MPKSLLDDYLPSYHVSEYHDIMVEAGSEKVFPTFSQVDLAESRLVKALLMIRGLPRRLGQGNNVHPTDSNTLTIQDMIKEGFILLAEDAPYELVVGAVGCFWKPKPVTIKMEPAAFLDFNERKYAKIGWNILIDKTGDQSVRVSTETRVQCLGTRSLLAFLPYWAVIRPFSGMIRVKMLEGIKRLAEVEAGK